MSAIDSILPGGQTAILIGMGEGLIEKLRERYEQVIVADPSRQLGSHSGSSTLQKGVVRELHGAQIDPDHLDNDIDCLLLAFGVSSLDDPVKQVSRWAERLANGGRLVALEWAAFPHLDPDSPESLHAEVLNLLERETNLRRMAGQQLVQVLQKSGLTHVRQQSSEATNWFSEQDVSFMTAEAITRLEETDGDSSHLVSGMREHPVKPAPLTVAYGTRKVVMQVQQARRAAEEKKETLSGADKLRPEDTGLRELLTIQLADLVDDPEQTANTLLGTFGARALGALSDETLLAEVTGMSSSAAKRFISLLTLGRRLNQPFESGVAEVHGPEDAYRHLGPQMAPLTREHFRGLYLDVKGKVVADEVISIGTLTTALVHPREVFGPAIERHCHSLLIAHNHPSGDPNPSPEDIHITRELAEAGRLLGIELLDHIIIGRDSYISMKERNYY
ncbi:DNA repair protein RadC [bacterium]|nr:DNA repair protein RadC [bacterium]